MKTHYSFRSFFSSLRVVTLLTAWSIFPLHSYAQTIVKTDSATIIQQLRDSLATQQRIYDDYTYKSQQIHAQFVVSETQTTSNQFEALSAILEILPREYAQPTRPYHATAGTRLHQLVTSLDGVEKVFQQAGDAKSFSADGKTLYTQKSFSYDSTVHHAWDVASGKEIPYIAPSESAPTDIETFLLHFKNKELRFLQTSSAPSLATDTHPTQQLTIAGKTVRIYDSVAQQTIQTIETPADSILTAAFSPNHQQILTTVVWLRPVNHLRVAYRWTCQLWDIATGKELVSFDYDASQKYHFSPNGKYLLAVDDRRVDSWDITTGKKAYTFTTPEKEPTIYNIRFSTTNDAFIILREDWTQSFSSICNLVTGEHIVLKEMSEAFISPDSSKVVAASNKRMHMWDMQTKQKIFTFPKTVTETQTALFSPDSKSVVTWQDEYFWGVKISESTKQLWDSETGEELFIRDSNDEIIPAKIVHVSPNGKNILLITTADSLGYVADVETGIMTSAFNQHLHRNKMLRYDQLRYALFSPDGKKIVFKMNDYLLLYNTDLERNNDLKEYVRFLQTSPDYYTQIDNLYYSENSNIILTSDRYLYWYAWDGETGTALPFAEALDTTTKLPVIGENGNIFVVDYLTDTTTWMEAPYSTTPRASFAGVMPLESPDKRTLITTKGLNVISVWDMLQQKELYHLYPADLGTPIADIGERYYLLYDLEEIAFNHDGSHFITTLTVDSTTYTHIVETATGKSLLTVRGSFQQLGADEQTLITQLTNNHDVDTTCIWDIHTGACIKSIPGTFKAYIADSERLITQINRPIAVDTTQQERSFFFDDSLLQPRESDTYIWSMQQPAPLCSISGNYYAHNIQQDKVFTSVVDSLYVWTLTTGTHLYSVPQSNQFLSAMNTDTTLLLTVTSIPNIYTDGDIYGYIDEQGIWHRPRRHIGRNSYIAHVWDIQTGQELMTTDSTYAIQYVSLSPDGTMLIASAYDQSYVWDIRTGNEVLVFDHPYAPDVFDFWQYMYHIISPNSKCLWVLNGKTWHLFSLDIQDIIDRGYDILNNYTLSPDDRRKYLLE